MNNLLRVLSLCSGCFLLSGNSESAAFAAWKTEMNKAQEVKIRMNNGAGLGSPLRP